MKTIIAVAVALVAGAAFAQSGADVLKTKGCNNCHEADKKKVGPSYKDIAAKKKSEAELVAKLKDANGHPKVNASEAEIKAAVQHVLATK